MSIENTKTVALVLLSCFLILGYVSDENSKTSRDKPKSVSITEDIKLYSNGKLIGSWTGIGRGRMVGNTYVFKTSRGAVSNKIQIKGDFIIETNDN